MDLEQFKEPIAGKIVDKIKFEVFSPSQIEKLSQLNCATPGLFEMNTTGKKYPQTGGVLDLRLGTSHVSFNCSTCKSSMVDCPGHFGHIDLEFPCLNIGYLKLIIKILQIICKNCSELLLPLKFKSKFSKILANPSLSNRQRKAIFESVVKEAKKIKICLNCGFYNGPVKKVNGFKLIHDCYKLNSTTKKTKEVTSQTIKQLKSDFQVVQLANPDLKFSINRIQEPLTPSVVLHLFENIKKEYIQFFSMCQGCSPADLIFTRILVPPPCIRPSVFSETQTGSNEDDLTIKLESVIWANRSIADHRKSGSNIFLMLEDWEYLQSYVSLYINGEITGLPPHLLDNSVPRGCMQRLKGKYGRFRGNLSGKRVDFSGRTVISPDPNLKIDEVAIPLLIAKIMTYPEVVNTTNIEHLKKLVINGTDIHPGANYVINRRDQTKQFLKFGSRQKVAENLRPGDVVERHMQNGDIVLFNRQPSLHRLSIMAHKAVIMDHRTFRFNECVCTPYNADFDGDEMNIHLPQTEEARAEASILMGVKNNILTPRNGEPLISATQDFITGAYLLTRKDTFLTLSQISQLVSCFLCDEDASKKINLPAPAIVKPIKLWSGKQVITTLLSPFTQFKSKLNLVTRTKSYSTNEDLCVNDGYCVIFNGELMCGIVDKSVIGSGSKNTIFYHILREYGSKECGQVMWRFSRITPLFLMTTGFSIGISDVTPSENLLHLLDELVESGYEKCEEYIKDCRNGDLPTQPGCSSDETLEALILRELSKIRDSAGKVCLQELPSSNSPLIMALSGSKGSNINISQMVACVGQQALNGKRTPNGFEARTLPHFKKHQKTPDAKGFVKSSFFSGLSPTEFFFHTMAGREGLVDTAVKTAETGYMQRRLVKCLEDLCVHYDDTVRSASNHIIQFLYGGDSLDPLEMESDSNPINFDSVYTNITNHSNPIDFSEPPLRVEQIEDYVNVSLTDWTVTPSPLFISNVTKFLENKTRQTLHYYNKFKLYITELEVCPIVKVTKNFVKQFLAVCRRKYERAKIEPGTAVGAICAQSIGEPGTQMTLKTFHFAGVATMNITLGVPRLKEIINATTNISTPVITAPLVDAENLENARIVKARIERTTLGDVCEFIEEIYLPNTCYLLLKLDKSRIKLLQLEVTEESICTSIANSKLKIKHEQLSIICKGFIALTPTEHKNSSKYFVMQQLKVAISNVNIKGFDGVSKAIIHMDEDSSDRDNIQRYKLIIEGNDLGAVMTTVGVKATQTTSNNTHSVYRTLGIEAARSTIIHEVVYTMKNHGMSIDSRHVMLLADLMTYKGEVLGITRYGLSKMKDSVLMLASFEKTSDHLFDAAYFGDCDDINGVSESIIMGRPIKLGTGLFKLLYKPDTDIVVSSTESFDPSGQREKNVKSTFFEEAYKNVSAVTVV